MVNDAVTTAEDAAITISVLANDTDPDGDTLTVSSVTQGGGGTVIINAGTTVTYTPNPNLNGLDSFTYTVSDGRGGSSTATVTVTVTAVNDSPFFDPIFNQSVNEDAGVQTISITGVSPGPADESGQTVIMTATSSNGAIIPAPTITGTGATRTLTYQPVANANGQVTITVTANDGQAANNTFSRTFTITVNAVNDSPFFDPIFNQSVNENAGVQTISITGVSPGPADESGQTVTMTAISSDTTIIPNPTISGTGSTRTLTYQPVANARGMVTIGVTANDGQATNNTFTRMFTIIVWWHLNLPIVQTSPQVSMIGKVDLLIGVKSGCPEPPTATTENAPGCYGPIPPSFGVPFDDYLDNPGNANSNLKRLSLSLPPPAVVREWVVVGRNLSQAGPLAVTFQWDDTSVPPRVGLLLLPPGGGQQINMRSSGDKRFTLNLDPAPSSAQFTIRATAP